MSGKGRFWGAADEDSSSDSDSSSGSDSSSSVEAPKAAAGAGKAAPGARFAAYESDSESDDDRMRVARSVKERNLEKVLTILKSMASQLKTFNWVATLEEFEKLTAAYDRNQGALAKDVSLIRKQAGMVFFRARWRERRSERGSRSVH
jgi:translation initiation factor 3 subunit C